MSLFLKRAIVALSVAAVAGIAVLMLMGTNSNEAVLLLKDFARPG